MTSDMPFAVFEIKEYMVVFRQLEERTFSGTTALITGLVRCTGTAIEDDDNTEFRLDVFFLKDGSDYPQPEIDLEDNTGNMFMPMNNMMAFVDILRNEAPIYGHLRADNPQLTSITTNKEPVGAGDEDYQG